MEKKKAALTSIIAAVFLTGFKFVVGILTNSLGIISEALHSLLDLVAAIITYISVRISDKPADKDHNYGHGKVENLSAFLEALILIITCAWIVYEAIRRLTTGDVVIEVTIWSYIVVITSIVIDINRSRMLYKVAKKHNSQALEADALHFSTDIFSSGVVLLGLICANIGYYKADAIAALGVALIVLVISYRLSKRAIDVLLDRTPKGIHEIVSTKLTEIPEIRNFHDLKIRSAGPETFINVNVHFDKEITLSLAHELCDRIERDLSETIPHCKVIVHPEPDDDY